MTPTLNSVFAAGSLMNCRNEKDLVSVVLVNLNGLLFIDQLFQSLLKQTYSPLEILLFDNGSSDGSVEHIRKNYPFVRLFELQRNAGFSRPNNEGIRKSYGEYVLTLNLDMILEKDFIEELVKAIKTDPSIGWVAGKLLRLTEDGVTDEIDCLGHHFHRDRYAKETDYSQPFRWSDYSRQRYVFGASACAALYRRAMLEDVAVDGEYFDENFVAYWEDVDLDWRAQLRGWRCLYTPKAVGYHVRGGSGLYRKPEVAAYHLTNRFLMVIKNDEITHLLQDAAPFMIRSMRDLLVFLRSHPRAVPLVLMILLRRIPRALAKRFQIQRGRSASSSYVRSLIR